MSNKQYKSKSQMILEKQDGETRPISYRGKSRKHNRPKFIGRAFQEAELLASLDLESEFLKDVSKRQSEGSLEEEHLVKEKIKSKQFVVGKVLGPHGVQGAFKIQLFSDDEDRLKDLSVGYLVNPNDFSDQKAAIFRLGNRKASSRILECNLISSPEIAKTYHSWLIVVDRDQARALPSDEYFICDLIGLDVYDVKYGFLGKVKDILTQTAQNLYCIEKKGENNLYFPAVSEIIQETDLDAHKISVTLPDGLYELYRS